MYFNNMYFEPRVLHTPAELCSEMMTKKNA